MPVTNQKLFESRKLLYLETEQFDKLEHLVQTQLPEKSLAFYLELLVAKIYKSDFEKALDLACEALKKYSDHVELKMIFCVLCLDLRRFQLLDEFPEHWVDQTQIEHFLQQNHFASIGATLAKLNSVPDASNFLGKSMRKTTDFNAQTFQYLYFLLKEEKYADIQGTLDTYYQLLRQDETELNRFLSIFYFKQGRKDKARSYCKPQKT